MEIVCYVQVGLVDAENNIVVEEIKEKPPQLDNNNGGMDAIRMIMECLSRYNNLKDEDREDCTPTDTGEDYTIPLVEGDCNADGMEELLEHAQTPLFAGASTSRLVSTLLILNCFAVFGVSNAFVDELLQLLHVLLPSDNYLPRSHYAARKYVVKLGLSYNNIHACPNGSCLFTLLEKTVTGSTQNQQRIVGRGCCFGRVGPVSDQQRVVDKFLLIKSQKEKKRKEVFSLPEFFGKIYFYCVDFIGKKKTISGLPGFLWHPNPTRLGLQG